MTKTSNEYALAFFQRKLQMETDPADVYLARLKGNDNFVIVDVRSPDSYRKSHIPGAINVPGGQSGIDALPKDKLLVVYCWGPGCNGATKAAVRLIEYGFQVKEMIGGIEYWEDRERYPIERDGAVQC